MITLSSFRTISAALLVDTQIVGNTTKVTRKSSNPTRSIVTSSLPPKISMPTISDSPNSKTTPKPFTQILILSMCNKQVACQQVQFLPAQRQHQSEADCIILSFPHWWYFISSDICTTNLNIYLYITKDGSTEGVTDQTPLLTIWSPGTNETHWPTIIALFTLLLAMTTSNCSRVWAAAQTMETKDPSDRRVRPIQEHVSCETCDKICMFSSPQ